MEITEGINKLFKEVKSKLGHQVRKLEIPDDTMCDLLSLAIGDYTEYVQSFVIENNWVNFYGKNINNVDLTMALSLRSLDLSKDYSLYFSKEVGLGSRAKENTWELKKGFIKLEPNKNDYYIEPGREILKVLAFDIPTTEMVKYSGIVGSALGNGTFSTFSASSLGFGGLYGSGNYLYGLPVSDLSYMASHLTETKKFFNPDVSYWVSATKDGGKIIHLINAQPQTWSNIPDNNFGQPASHNAYIYYYYYDTYNKTDAEILECRKQDPNIVISPDQIKLSEIDFELLNLPSQNIVRKLLIGHLAETIGFVRGKFSGNINFVSSSLTLDYKMFLDYGKTERKEALDLLKERLEKLSPYYVMEKQAGLVENALKIKKGTPLGIYII